MNLLRILRSRDALSWHDDGRDPLTDALRALAAEPTDAAARVERNRPVIREAFVRFNAARTPPRVARPGMPWFRTPRLAPALVAGVLLVGLAVGGVAASGPGEPMYPLRLGVEELLLPAKGPARLQAQLDRLDRRLDETADALGSGDTRGAEAAVQAFERIASQLASGTAPGGDVQASVDRLSLQVRRLEQLVERTSLSNRAGALEAGARALRWLRAGGPPGHMPPSQVSPSPGASRQPAPAPTPAASDSRGPASTQAPGPDQGGGEQPGPTGSAQSNATAGPRHSPQATGGPD